MLGYNNTSSASEQEQQVTDLFRQFERLRNIKCHTKGYTLYKVRGPMPCFDMQHNSLITRYEYTDKTLHKLYAICAKNNFLPT